MLAIATANLFRLVLRCVDNRFDAPPLWLLFFLKVFSGCWRNDNNNEVCYTSY